MLLMQLIDLTPTIAVQLDVAVANVGNHKRLIPETPEDPFQSITFHFRVKGDAAEVYHWTDLYPTGRDGYTDAGRHVEVGGTPLTDHLLTRLEVRAWVVMANYGFLARLSTEKLDEYERRRKAAA